MAMRLGMLGTWHVHAEGMVRQIAAHPNEFSLLACHEPDPATRLDRLEKWRRHLPDVVFLDEPQDVLALGLDGVLVEGQVYDNLRLAKLAVEHGLPVLLEKPAGTDLEQFTALHQAARLRGRHLQMAYLFRYQQSVRTLLQLCRDGELGRVYHFRGRLPKDLSTYGDLSCDLRPYPGGIFFEMAGHLVDLMVSLLGKPRDVHPFLGHHHAEPGAYVDNALAVFAYEHAWATIEVTNLEVATGARRIEVFGTRGAVVVPHLGSGHLANDPIERLEFYQADSPQWRRLEFPAATLQIGDLREFAACARGEKQPDYPPDHDLLVQELLLKSSGMV